MIEKGCIRIENIVPENERNQNVRMDVLRLDLVHPVISGNKWFKLAPFLEEAQRRRMKRILTRGGAWSNHIVATAHACRETGLKCALVIRGERPQHLSQSLQQASALGAELIFQSRLDFGRRQIPTEWMSDDTLYVPEGGSSPLGAEGASRIMELFRSENYSHIMVSAGTGTTAAGLLHKMRGEQILVVIPVLKGFYNLEHTVKKLANGIPLRSPQPYSKFDIQDNYHFGGYAKATPLLFDFMNDFFDKTGIRTDFVYTGKMFFAAYDMLEKNKFPPNSRVLLIHTGGLQGNRSLDKGTLIFQDV